MCAAVAASRAARGRSGGRAAAPLREAELVALWLLGLVPPALLPWPLLRPGRAGRGPGPDVREAAFAGPDGVIRSGAVEVHLAAGDFVRHGHGTDGAYAGVVLHLVWTDDRSERAGRSGPQPLPGGGCAPTVEVGPALGRDPARLRRLLRRGPGSRGGTEPCAEAAPRRGAAATSELVRAQGRMRMAELAWRAAELAAEHGWDGAWRRLLDRALAASAGRRREPEPERAALARRVSAALAPEPLRSLAVAADGAPGAPTADARGRPSPGVLIAALRVGTVGSGHGALGRGRAAEIGWNAALPLLAAAAAAYGDAPLARATAALVERWPAPRPYGRTRALAGVARATAAWRRSTRAGPAAPPGAVVRARRVRRLPTVGRRPGPTRPGPPGVAPADRNRSAPDARSTRRCVGRHALSGRADALAARAPRPRGRAGISLRPSRR